jgi:hypothetical protein
MEIHLKTGLSYSQLVRIDSVGRELFLEIKLSSLSLLQHPINYYMKKGGNSSLDDRRSMARSHGESQGIY